MQAKHQRIQNTSKFKKKRKWRQSEKQDSEHTDACQALFCVVFLFRSSLRYVDSIQIKQQESCNGSQVTESIGCKAASKTTDTMSGVVAHC